MPEQLNIAAIVITYNRLEFLKEIISALREQSLKPDKIIVVNNSSSDGTSEWLDSQADLHVIVQDNLGSSGGQYRGIKTAFRLGYEWIWTMDDDVVPDSDCLERLMYSDDKNTIRTPLRYTPQNQPFFNDVIDFNLSNPFKGIWVDVLNERHLEYEIIPAKGITFEGPLMHRSIVEKIGFPEKKFFIYADDTEYFVRAAKANANIVVVRDAILRRKLPAALSDFNNWKLYYYVRNIIAIDVMHGTKLVRLLRPLGYLLKWMKRANSFKNLMIVFKGFRDSYFYKSEN